MDLSLLFPGQINDSIDLPRSKSITNRALLIDMLSGFRCNITNLAVCDDTRAMLSVTVAERNRRQGAFADYNIGAAGTAMRFLTAYFATREGNTTQLHGTERMHNRPIAVEVDALRHIGAGISYLGRDGFPPLEIKGLPLGRNSTLEIRANISSQYISALMMIAPYVKGGLKLKLVGEMNSRPYIIMTMKLMQLAGCQIEFHEDEISINDSPYKPFSYAVEPDWSAASYWYSIAALSPDARIFLPHLSPDSIQGDAEVIKIFELMGVMTLSSPEGVAVIHDNRAPLPEKIDLDMSATPDLAQTVAVTAALLGIPFTLRGLSTLKIKETNRLEALKCELAKLGCEIRIEADSTLHFNGKREEISSIPVIDTYDDHRMAMAFAPAAILFPGLTIKDAQVVSKSYDNFWIDLQHAGIKIMTSSD